MVAVRSPLEDKIMPRMMHPKHGPFAYLKDATITIGDQEFVVKWQTGNPPDSFLTFFGKDRLLKELEETPTPPGYFKKFRGEKYTDVIKSSQRSCPHGSLIQQTREERSYGHLMYR